MNGWIDQNEFETLVGKLDENEKIPKDQVEGKFGAQSEDGKLNKENFGYALLDVLQDLAVGGDNE